VFGEWGWTRDYDVQVAQNFERRAANDKSQSAVAAKVVVVSRVTIHGLGTHTGVGEEWADDENAATRGSYISVAPQHVFRCVDEQAFRDKQRNDFDCAPIPSRLACDVRQAAKV
jgi:hypothetical protein